jgi:uncharacterized protein
VSSRTHDINGWFEVRKNPLSKVGVFPYLGRQIGAPDPTRLYMVLRPPEELGDPETVASFRLLPFVDEHAMLGSEDEKLTPAEQKGVHGVIGEQVYFDDDDDTLYGNLKVWSEGLAADLAPNNPDGRREVSCGYRCVYDFTPGVYKGVRYDAVQRVLRGNHVALVRRGRCGPQIAVLDALAVAMDGMDTMDPEMMQKVLAALQAAVVAVQGAMGGADTNAAPVGGETKAAPENGGEDTVSGGAGGDTVTDGEADTLKGGNGSDTIMGGEESLSGKDSGDMKTMDTTGQDALTAIERAELTRLRASEAARAALPTMDEASIIASLSRRDALAERVKARVGTFDHSGMTLAQVAAYGVEKLALTGVPAGSEMVALDAALQAMGDTPRVAASHGLDTASDGAKAGSFVDRHIRGEKAA